MLSIIIVGWNCVHEIGGCLEALRQHPPSMPFEIVYVDNASTDGSADRVAAEHPAVRTLRNTRNQGFQRANNQALAVAEGSFLLLLNPDTRVLPGSLDALVGFLQARPEVGAVSPRCEYPDGRLQWAMAPFPSLPVIRDWFWTAHAGAARLIGRPPRANVAASSSVPTQEQAYAYGACLATKREVIDAVGPMDEGYFLAGGEVAWCCEMRRRGWKSYFVAESTIVHHESTARGQRSWVSELDWIASHRRLLYVYEGLEAGLAGDLFFSAHLVLFTAKRLARAVGSVFAGSQLTRRSSA